MSPDDRSNLRSERGSNENEFWEAKWKLNTKHVENPDTTLLSGWLKTKERTSEALSLRRSRLQLGPTNVSQLVFFF